MREAAAQAFTSWLEVIEARLAAAGLSAHRAHEVAVEAFCAIEGAFLRDWFPRSRLVRDYTMEDWDHGELREVDWMYGAAWIIRKTALDRVGLFDEGFFYLYEDIDLCFRMKKQGMKILYDPRAVVTHYLPRERKGIFHQRIRVHLRSILRYLLKDYFGLPLGTKTSPA